MKIQKAVVTAAAPGQRTLPLQTVIDRDGQEKAVLRIIVEEIRHAGVDQIAVIVSPGDGAVYARAAGDSSVRFIEQEKPNGYAAALSCASGFAGDDPFLHLVGDHLYVSANGNHSALDLVQAASKEGCAISAVQATRETLLPLYGAIGGQRVVGKSNLYRIERVIEKPTPTEAEQSLTTAGLRAGYYFCFFGMHVLTPTFMDILARHDSAATPITVSAALSELAGREQYLAFEEKGRRYDVGAKYGLFQAQLALALQGKDRDTLLAQMVELLALQRTDSRETESQV
ncbi:MAG TPA: sugar phosphate nucleotidyltransferase [Bryobacteraceae bacterium]|jgi:UTP--glucose-1-phosphate uridylyltransferase|nr:sugar phosphate nucleotidyltransferase [Bryobacteraceae bacterium]